MEVPLEQCKELRKPWSRALVVKVLGKTFSYLFLERRLSDLWGMGNSVEIIDLDRGFSSSDFIKLLNIITLLRMIQGHYITVSK